MKQYYYIITMAVALAFTACENKMDDDASQYEALSPTLNAETTFLEFSETELSKTVSVSCNGYWKAARKDSWISISPTEGKGDGLISISLQKNVSTAARTGSFTITNGITTTEVAVSQATLPFVPPTVGNVTTEVLSKSSASCTFSFSSADFVVSAHGVCYSATEAEPTLENSEKTVGENINSGTVTFTLNQLTPLTQYYVRGYATTNRGTTYGNVSTFTTPKVNAPGDSDNPTPNY
ncbi:MAG: BACON domain-containing protein [Prevotella sp.]|nr:BACON domain-containing protein [Prevotella sp.]